MPPLPLALPPPAARADPLAIQTLSSTNADGAALSIPTNPTTSTSIPANATTTTPAPRSTPVTYMQHPVELKRQVLLYNDQAQTRRATVAHFTQLGILGITPNKIGKWNAKRDDIFQAPAGRIKVGHGPRSSSTRPPNSPRVLPAPIPLSPPQGTPLPPPLAPQPSNTPQTATALRRSDHVAHPSVPTPPQCTAVPPPPSQPTHTTPAPRKHDHMALPRLKVPQNDSRLWKEGERAVEVAIKSDEVAHPLWSALPPYLPEVESLVIHTIHSTLAPIWGIKGPVGTTPATDLPRKPDDKTIQELKLAIGIARKKEKRARAGKAARGARRKLNRKVEQLRAALRAVETRNTRHDTERLHLKNHQRLVKNPWETAKEVLTGIKKGDQKEPECGKEALSAYWTQTLSDPCSSQSYELPVHLLPLQPRAFNPRPDPFPEPPLVTEEDMTTLLASKQAKAAPGLDGIPYAVYKGFACLLPVITHLINLGLADDANIPANWTTAATIFLHKKGSTADPSNFRPICLGSCLGKLFTSTLQRQVNGHMERWRLWSAGQKGFRTRTSGCLEHQAVMERLIQKSKAMTLVATDLSNAFGSVRHAFIEFALKRYLFPVWMVRKVRALYGNLQWVLPGTTAPIQQKIGVFQGDPLSPTLFNVAINMVLEALDNPLLAEKHGVSPFSKDAWAKTNLPGAVPRALTHLTFADDVLLVAKTPKNAQHLINTFQRALDWSLTLKTRADKFGCVEFYRAQTEQSEAGGWVQSFVTTRTPRLSLHGATIPHISKSTNTWRLLGQQLPLEKPNRPEAAQEFTTHAIETFVNRIDAAPFSDVSKLRIYHLAFPAYAQWHLRVNQATPSWAVKTLRPLIVRTLKKWGALGPNYNTSRLFLPTSANGLGLSDPLLLWQTCRIQRAFLLTNSRDPIVRAVAILHHEPRGVKWDPFKVSQRLATALTTSSPSIKATSKTLTKLFTSEYHAKLAQDLRRLKCQGVLDRTPTTPKILWLSHFWDLPVKVVQTGLKALNDTLATAENRVTLFKSTRATTACLRCKADHQNLTHVLTQCCIALGIGSHSSRNRVTWRHNEVLRTITKHVQKVSPEWDIFGDLPGLDRPPSNLRNSHSALLPDIILVSEDAILIGELTSPMEHNMAKQNSIKTAKYETLRDNMAAGNPEKEVSLHCFEVGARGGVGASLREFLKACHMTNAAVNTIMQAASARAIQCSSLIFKYRDTHDWPLSIQA